jgi:5-methylcytosine-specific restriction endonuclease McrA
MHDALLLNADFAPVGVVSWQRAVCLVLDEKVRIVERYADRMVRAPAFEMAWPAVVHLVRYVRVRTSPPLNRLNVLARDRFTCRYCGLRPRHAGRPDTRRLTLDHVIPRKEARDGVVVVPWMDRPVPVTSWENLVTACAPCNHQKGSRSLEDAGLSLPEPPRRPRPQDAIRVALARVRVPDEWRDYLPGEI